jgi:hypothetical protein|tara:strand:+ start:395 stop:1513 length:1119 start_codon:yes stop_codon:yes gene_type:complete
MLRSKKRQTKTKIKTRAKRKTGLAGIPLDSFNNCSSYFWEQIEGKDKSKIIKDYIRESCSDSKDILELSDEYLRSSSVAAAIFWNNSKLTKSDDFIQAFTFVNEVFIPEKREQALYHIEHGYINDDETPVVISPAERLVSKIDSIILEPLDYLIDSWTLGGVVPEFDLYNLCVSNGIKGNATKMIVKFINQHLNDYRASVNKVDDDIVEAYATIPIKEQKRRISIFESMLDDLERIHHTTLMQRKVKKQTIKSADRQVTKVKYQLRDKEYKLESINPILIVGSKRLYMFNTKTKVLTKLIATDVGFEVSGSTVKNFDIVNSISTVLRKPDEVLQVILGRADKTIDDVITKLTTKNKVPTGRINTDTILLRTT